MAQVFISHSSKDKKQTMAVVKYLEDNGVSCWVSYRNIPPGVDFGDVIPPAIRDCPAFVILLSANSVASADVANELTLAARRLKDTGKLILPLLLEEVALPDKFDYHLATVQTYRHYADPEAALKSILRELRRILPEEGPMPQMEEATAEECRQIAERKFREGNFEAACTWYQKAVELLRKRLPPEEQTPTNSTLEEWYQKGLERNDVGEYAQAVEWYRKAAERGHAKAQTYLGFCYRKGYGVPRNDKTAVAWYQKAADQGLASAQFNLGVCYGRGYGVPQDYKTAVAWYQKAADQGDANAQYNLGVCYERGYGVPQDYKTAVAWYQKAADQGYASAQFNLGVCYRNGYGVPRNDKTAVAWYQKAADQGDADAQYNLAWSYENGKGVSKDLTEARKWYQKTADQGDEDAKQALDRLK